MLSQDAAGGLLATRTFGSVDKAALVLLHGFLGDGRSFAGLMPELERHFYCITVDALGHGASPAPADVARYRLEQGSWQLETLLGRLGIERAHLFGYSMGGRQALGFAVRFPKRVLSLTLENASPGIEDASERRKRRDLDESRARLIETQGIEAFVAAWERLPLFASQRTLPAALLEAQRQVRLQQRPCGLAASLRGAGSGAMSPLWHRLPGLSPPLFFLAGELDEKYRAIGQRVSEVAPYAHYAVMAGAGHNIHLERPRVFTKALLSFLTYTSSKG